MHFQLLLPVFLFVYNDIHTIITSGHFYIGEIYYILIKYECMGHMHMDQNMVEGLAIR